MLLLCDETSETTASGVVAEGSPGRPEKAKMVRRRGTQMHRTQSDHATAERSTFLGSRMSDRSMAGLRGGPTRGQRPSPEAR